MPTARRFDKLPERDRAFLAAFEYHLTERGWTVLGFCRRTRVMSLDGRTQLIHPNNVTKWRRGASLPGSRAVMITCGTFGVARSTFYLVGETLVRLADAGEPGTRENLEASLACQLDPHVASKATEEWEPGRKT